MAARKARIPKASVGAKKTTLESSNMQYTSSTTCATRQGAHRARTRSGNSRPVAVRHSSQRRPQPSGPPGFKNLLRQPQTDLPIFDLLSYPRLPSLWVTSTAMSSFRPGSDTCCESQMFTFLKEGRGRPKIGDFSIQPRRPGVELVITEGPAGALQ